MYTRNKLIQSFTDRYGKLDPKAITAFVSFVCVLITWGANLFFNLTVNELIINNFFLLVFGLLGLKSMPWGKKDAVQLEPQENKENKQNESE